MLEPPTLLIVDDQPENLRVAIAHLEAYGYDLLTARSGEAAVRRARATRPDLILLDVQMPGIDGFETCRRLKASAETADIPVLFLTALAQSEDKQRAFSLGGVNYVTKPFEASELQARVQTHLTLQHQRRALQGQTQRLEAAVDEATDRYRREAARLEAALAEREQLLAVLRAQGDQLHALTDRLVTDHAARDQDLSRYLRSDLGERLSLVQAALEQAKLTTAEGPTRQGVERALHLLGPAVRESAALPDRVLAPAPGIDNPLLRLSAREREVFGLLVAGRSNKQIAATLDVAPTTVSTYRLRILDKLEVEDVPSLVRLALQFS